MRDYTSISVGIRQIDGRLFVDRNDLIAVVGEIDRRGGRTNKVIDFLSTLDPGSPQNNLDVEGP